MKIATVIAFGTLILSGAIAHAGGENIISSVLVSKELSEAKQRNEFLGWQLLKSVTSDTKTNGATVYLTYSRSGTACVVVASVEFALTFPEVTDVSIAKITINDEACKPK